MLRHVVKILAALALAVLIYSIGVPGCSPTHFASLKTLTCEDFPESYNCVSKPQAPRYESDYDYESDEPPANYLEFNYEISLGRVDIIFVIDNSSSMAIEHRNISKQFKSFLNHIRDVQYRIAVITTDISASPENPVRNAYYQDGNFIPIAGQLFLRNERLGEKPSDSVIEAFTKAIAREETIRCDSTNQPRRAYRNQYDRLYEGDVEEPEAIQCPSHDERGTYAMNLAIMNHGQRHFFREDAHLMFVVLSDEDVRSSQDYIDQDGFDHYAFENLDYPEVLVRNMRDTFGSLKSFSVHSIIIPPRDSRCLSEQNRRGSGQGTGRGYYGEQYARLSKARDDELTQYGNLLRGSVISICSRSYGTQLGRVAVAAETIRMSLPCSDPESIDFYINGKKTRLSYDIEGLTLIAEPSRIALNSSVHLRVICEE